MSTLSRNSRRIWNLIGHGTKGRISSNRYSSSHPKPAIVTGSNGEKIFGSPYGEISYQEVPIHEYVWRDFQNHPNHVALECGVTGRKYTYAAARDACNWTARSLSDLGFRPGDIIALIAPNLPEYSIAFLGILEAGLVVTTVNPYYAPDEIRRQLENSGAKGIITSAEVVATTQKAVQNTVASKLPIIVIDDGTLPVPEGCLPFTDLITKGRTLPPLPPREWTADDLAVLPYSSGTTGLAKGVMLSHRNLVSNMMMSLDSAGDDVWLPTTDTYQEVIPTVLPMFHIYGMNCIMLPKLLHGAKLISLPKFTPETFVNMIENNKVTSLFLVPPLVMFLTAHPAIKKDYLCNVRSLISGAAPIAEGDVLRFYEKYNIDINELRFYQGYGLTETSPATFLQSFSAKKYASIGSPIASSEARLIDLETQNDISTPGKTGELWVRGSHVMLGYYKNEEATKEMLLPGGWLRTGDIAYFDEGYDFFITDRLKELIKVKGFQVPPAELEGILRTHPDIEEAAVIGIPDARSGELPRAIVIPKKNKILKVTDVQNFVKGKVSEYKELAGGVIFVDSIPKNPTGKILRRELKLKYSE